MSTACILFSLPPQSCPRPHASLYLAVLEDATSHTSRSPTPREIRQGMGAPLGASLQSLCKKSAQGITAQHSARHAAPTQLVLARGHRCAAISRCVSESESDTDTQNTDGGNWEASPRGGEKEEEEGEESNLWLCRRECAERDLPDHVKGIVRREGSKEAHEPTEVLLWDVHRAQMLLQSIQGLHIHIRTLDSYFRFVL